MGKVGRLEKESTLNMILLDLKEYETEQGVHIYRELREQGFTNKQLEYIRVLLARAAKKYDGGE